MAKGNGKAEEEGVDRACDVCKLLRRDFSRKRVLLCRLCNAWICDECRPQWGWRAVAALKRRMLGQML